MSRKALAVVLASAVLWTGIATAAPAATEPAEPAAQTTEARAPAAGNQRRCRRAPPASGTRKASATTISVPA